MRRRREKVQHFFGTHMTRMGRDALPNEDTTEGRQRDGAHRARLQSDACHEYRWHESVVGGDQSVSVETSLRADLEPDLAQQSPR
jgi:hypothetical protein